MLKSKTIQSQVPRWVAALCLLALVLMPAVTAFGADTFAADAAGKAELNLLIKILTGNIGFTLGLLVVIMGLWVTTVKGNAGAGVMLMVLGVLITLLPTFFNGVRLVVCPLVKALGGICGQWTL